MQLVNVIRTCLHVPVYVEKIFAVQMLAVSKSDLFDGVFVRMIQDVSTSRSLRYGCRCKFIKIGNVGKSA